MRQWCILFEHYSLLMFRTLPLWELRRFTNWLFLRRQVEHKAEGRRHSVSFYMNYNDEKVFWTKLEIIQCSTHPVYGDFSLTKLRIMPKPNALTIHIQCLQECHVFFFCFAVVESIMRGENVGITPRRSRSSTVLTQQQPVSDMMVRIIAHCSLK